MLDLETLRVAQAAVGLLTFALVFFGTYLATRAPYARWWSLVVVLSSTSSVLYLLDSGVGIAVADAAGNALSVLSAGFAWAAARSLRGLATDAWRLAAVPVLIAVATLVGPRDGGAVSGTAALMLGMALQFGLAAWQLWLLLGEQPRAVQGDRRGGVRVAVASVALTATVLAAFYATRALTYVTLGPASDAYTVWAGPATTTIVVMLAMVVVTYSVTEISRFEVAERWRRRAERDDLTRLLTRDPFLRRAGAVLASRGERPATVMLADFDRFKELNDTHGHAAGDAALVAFADACRAVLGADPLACRWGGEEFAAVIEDADAEAALAASGEFARLMAVHTADAPAGSTVSFGLAVVEAGEGLVDALARADEALYAAKSAGRDRAVVHGDTLASS
ncbi:diguanylate cyclase [Demequina sp. NBRC 110057]|uniref:GGDEF domain-containing protein n=1 Tax=Demequina sp. NBRC 110057 TaxID=1570346 RepID=UPI000A05B76E|nr:GGDEF domain-containing protein [Demequina sp. NBRC 110057]